MQLPKHNCIYSRDISTEIKFDFLSLLLYKKSLPIFITHNTIADYETEWMNDVKHR